MAEKELNLKKEMKGEVSNVNEVKKDYVKVTELTEEDILKLPKFKCEVKTTSRAFNGNVSNYYSFTIKLAEGLNLQVSNKDFKETDYFYLKKFIFEGKYNLSNSDVYVKEFPCRFLKGTATNSDGVSYEYHLIQVIIAKKLFYSVYLNKSNNVLNLFDTYVELGIIPKPNWEILNTVAVKDENGEDTYIF